MNMEIAAVVILYHPEANAVSNIKTYSEFVDKIYIFDNSESESGIKEALLQIPNLEFYQDYENNGIAKRLNEACEKAIVDGYNWILTMDQDTCFSREAISYYFACFEQQKDKEKLAAVGTKFSRERELTSATCIANEVEELITSGMLLNLSLFKKIGGFDEALFIDYVDNDYCIRSVMLGYSVLQFANISILHQLGKLVNNASIKTLYLIKKKKAIHSPLRCYYMYRNMLYLEKKFEHSNKKFVRETQSHILGRIKMCMLYGREAKKIKRYVELAKSDFKSNKFGRIEKELQ